MSYDILLHLSSRGHHHDIIFCCKFSSKLHSYSGIWNHGACYHACAAPTGELCVEDEQRALHKRLCSVDNCFVGALLPFFFFFFFSPSLFHWTRMKTASTLMSCGRVKSVTFRSCQPIQCLWCCTCFIRRALNEPGFLCHTDSTGIFTILLFSLLYIRSR